MFRSHPGWRSAARQAVFAVIPVLMGAAVLGAAADTQAPAGTLRLEATQSSARPTVDGAPAPAAAAPVVLPAGPGGELTVLGGGLPAPDGQADGPAAAVAAATPAGGAGPTLAVGAGAGTGEAGVAGVVAIAADLPAGAGPATAAPPASTSTSTSTTTITTTTTTTAPARGGRHREAEAEVVPRTNEDRVAAGLGTLSRSACLDAVAAGYAEQMAASGVLAHNPGAGPAITGCRPQATWGDNVGMSTACDTARLQREWMASPGHRRNILTGAFTLIGVGAWTDAQGTCWVQVLFSS